MTMRKQRPDESDEEYSWGQEEYVGTRHLRRAAQREREIDDFLAVIRAGGMASDDERRFAPDLVLLNTFARHKCTQPSFFALRDLMRAYGDRVLMAELKDAEYRVWRAIFTRTWDFGAGKLADRLTIEQIVDGYPGKVSGLDGLPLFLGCGVGRTQAKPALRRLVEKGVAAHHDTTRRTATGAVKVRYLAPVAPFLAISIIVGWTLHDLGHAMTPDQRLEIARTAENALRSFGRAGQDAQDRGERGPLARFYDLKSVQDGIDTAYCVLYPSQSIAPENRAA